MAETRYGLRITFVLFIAICFAFFIHGCGGQRPSLTAKKELVSSFRKCTVLEHIQFIEDYQKELRRKIKKNIMENERLAEQNKEMKADTSKQIGLLIFTNETIIEMNQHANNECRCVIVSLEAKKTELRAKLREQTPR